MNHSIRTAFSGLMALLILAPATFREARADEETGDRTIELIFKGRKNTKVKKDDPAPDATPAAPGAMGLTLAASPTPALTTATASTPGASTLAPAAHMEACETDGADLAHWIADQQAKGAKFCGAAKFCKNCCGEEHNQDQVQAFCGSTGGDFSSTTRSAEVCEGGGGTAYIYEWIDKATAAGKVSCTHEKVCSNCCGPDNTLDKFVAYCK